MKKGVKDLEKHFHLQFRTMGLTWTAEIFDFFERVEELRKVIYTNLRLRLEVHDCLGCPECKNEVYDE